MSKTRRWGVLGTARITSSFLGGVARSAEAGEVVAVASRDVARGRAFAEAHGVADVAASYDALLARDDIDFVYVPLPNRLHAEWVVRALDAGKHVLCEKPLAMTAAEALLVADAAARAGRHVAEAFMYRHHPQWAALRRVIDGGRLGSIVALESHFTFPLDPGDLTAGSAALGGGALRDVGCYCVHFSRMVADAEVARVSAMARGADVDTTIVGTLEMTSGALASFEASIEQDERRGARVTGTAATAVVERPWLPGDGPASIRIEQGGEVVDRVTVEGANNHQLQVEAFVRAAEGREAPEWPIADALANARVIDALFEAVRTGRTVSIA